MGQRGRPGKLTPEAQKAICEALEGGNTRKDAALSAGVCYDTFLEWYKKGKGERANAFSDFSLAVDAAESRAVMQHVKTVHEARERDWRASAWYLERRRPDDFAKPADRLAITGPNGGAVEVKIFNVVRPQGEDEGEGRQAAS